MADKTAMANTVYTTVCKALDERKWNYEKDEEKKVVHFGVNGDDIPMKLVIKVDEDRQLLRVMSPLPFEMAKDKRAEGAIAACMASFGMADGNFDYDLSDGRIVFRMTHPFHDSVIGVGAIQYMISCTCAMVDKYNDKFLALSKGLIDISGFIKKEQ